jgi:leucyl/phenylalanyl-tRNA---protein transferase
MNGPTRHHGLSAVARSTILPPSRFFPPAETVDEDGFVGFGGKLTPEWLLDAYAHGIFPWPISDARAPLAWWSPDPRAIIEFDRFHVPQRLQRTCRSGRFTVTFDTAFEKVIRGCATGHGRKGATWLIPAMIDAYLELFRLGHAHSVESWCDGQLAGGVYGVAIAGVFAAESMFYRIRDGSKVALVHLVEHLRRRGYGLLDIQQLTPHTTQFGAVEIPRREFLVRLAAALAMPVSFADVSAS